ncbi:MAG: Putative aminopeptidase, partial [uncultured Gemmatimonadetes bacterium]
MKRRLCLTLGAAIAALPGGALAQTFPTNNPVLRQIWTEAHQNGQLVPLAQALLDSVGPRLTGSPGHRAGNDWAAATFQRWGIPARNEQYGTWRSWRRGITHVDLLEPRLRTLEGTMLAWSPGTNGPVNGGVAILPDSGFEAWLPSVRGKYVLISFPQPTCRPDASWKEFATPESFEKMRQ